MKTFKEDIGYAASGNQVAEPSDLGQIKGTKQKKSSIGIMRVKNKIDTKPKVEAKKMVVSEGFREVSRAIDISKSGSGPFHKEKAIITKEGNIHKASDFGPDEVREGHNHVPTDFVWHSAIAKAAGVIPYESKGIYRGGHKTKYKEGFIGHDNKFYLKKDLDEKIKEHIKRHGVPADHEKISFDRPYSHTHSILQQFHENKFVENKGSHAVIGFVRANPPTVGHEALVQKIRSHAALVGGTPHLFLSRSEGNKNNPLSYKEKLDYARKAFGDVVKETEAKNPYEVAQELNGKFDHLTVVAGSDRIPSYNKLLERGQGKDFKYKTINVVSAGDRNPDSKGVSGISASMMRQHALNQNSKAFAAGLPSGLRKDSESIMKSVRKGILKEWLNEEVYDETKKWHTYDADSGPYHKEKAIKHDGTVYKASDFPYHAVSRPVSRMVKMNDGSKQKIDSGKRMVHHEAIAHAAGVPMVGAGFIGHDNKFYDYDHFDRLATIHMKSHGMPAKGAKISLSNVSTKPQSSLAAFHDQKNEEIALINILENYLDKAEIKLSDKAEKNLTEKSEEHNIPLGVLKEVYSDGIDEWYIKQDETFLLPEQWAFNKVNRYINQLEMAWGIIANAGNGDWDKESKEWKEAAQRWRDDYFKNLKENVDIYKLKCEPCDRQYSSRTDKQGWHDPHKCPTCKTPLKVVQKISQGSISHPERVHEEHGAGHVGTSKLTKKYASVTPGQDKLKVLQNKYIEDKFVTEDNLRQMKGHELYKAFIRDGWVHKRTAGSHRIMHKQGVGSYVLSHGDREEIHSPMLARIVKKSGLNPARLYEEEELLEVNLVKRKDYPSMIGNHAQVSDFDIKHEGQKIGRVYTHHYPDEKKLHISYFEVQKEHQGKHVLHSAVKQLLKHYPEVKTVSGDRITGRHKGFNYYPIHEGDEKKYFVVDNLDSLESPFHKEKAVKFGDKIHRQSDFPKEHVQDTEGPAGSRLAYHYKIASAAMGHEGKYTPNLEYERGFIGHNNKYYSEQEMTKFANDHILKHGYPEGNVKLRPDRHFSPLMQFHEEDDKERRNRILKRYGAKGTGTDRRRQMDAVKAFEGWKTCEHRCPQHGIWNHDIPPDMACHNPAFHPCGDCMMHEPEAGSQFANLKIDLSTRKKK